jgi:hypothetical protein
MTDQPSFEQFFETDLIPTLQPLEKQRKSVVKKITFSCGALVAVGLLIAILLWVNAGDPMLLLFPAIGTFAIGAGLIKWMSSKYVHAFKNQVVRPIVQYISPDLTYLPKNGISESRFRASGIFRHRVDRYRCEDMVRGLVDKTRIEFSEIHAEYKTETRDSKGHRRTQWHTIFQGLFFIADFNKHFKGRTFVLPDSAEKLFGQLGQKLQAIGKSHGELVKLEDPEFEREFAAYSTDQVEARYILSPALMRRMLDFKNKTGEKVYFSFTGGEVNIGIASTKNRFEPKLFSTVLDIELAREFVNDLQLALDVVEDLNLNTRIWTKE